ncbi:MAG: hypothetical protein ACI8W8_002414 [Rhodothermales bacterium]
MDNTGENNEELAEAIALVPRYIWRNQEIIMRILTLCLALATLNLPAELLSNGDFKAGLDGWKLRRHPEFRHITPSMGRADGLPTLNIAVDCQLKKKRQAQP